MANGVLVRLLMVLCAGMQCLIVVFPDHTYLHFAHFLFSSSAPQAQGELLSSSSVLVCKKGNLVSAW